MYMIASINKQKLFGFARQIEKTFGTQINNSWLLTPDSSKYYHKVQQKFSNHILALKWCCCHGQLTMFPMVTCALTSFGKHSCLIADWSLNLKALEIQLPLETRKVTHDNTKNKTILPNFNHATLNWLSFYHENELQQQSWLFFKFCPILTSLGVWSSFILWPSKRNRSEFRGTP